MNGEEIVTTVDHPFYVKNQGFIKAGELIVGDELLDSNCNVLLVENHSVELTDEPTTLYNFQVEDFHTYYVGENSVYVHNKNCGANEQWVDPYDEAKQIADQHVGPNAFNYKDTNIKVSSNGLKTARYDIDPTSNHVQRKGPHINLETYEKPFGTSNQKPLTNIHLRWRK